MEETMIPEKMNEAMNEQIAKEFYAEYLYLAMAVKFAEKSLGGFANWFFKQAEEEHVHAMKFVNFILERGGSVKVPAIPEPKLEAVEYIDFFKAALQHEIFVTNSINDLMDLAIKINDHASKSILQWFVDEQIEEEESVGKIVDHLELIGNSRNGIFMLDRQLGER